MHIIRPLFLLSVSFIIFVALISFAATAHAASAVWNTTPNVELYHAKLKGGHQYMSNENITIQYNAQVVTDAGVVIPPGGSVSAGTEVTYEFIPHAYTDISWFGVGNGYDPPYGSWMAGATDPGDRCVEKDFYDTNGQNNDQYNLYAALSINPPAKTVTSPCGVMSGGESSTCTLNTPGQQPAHFDFASTNGSFYASDLDTAKNPPVCAYRGGMKLILSKKKYTCDGGNAICASFTFGGVYVLNVPAQTIDYPITVTAPVGNPPVVTNVSSASGSCTVGESYTINMTGTDSDNDQIRYLVDWDNNGSVDQIVPPSGYVNSGTTQQASRTFSTSGSKTVQVRAEDAGGQMSAWSSFSFSCSDAPPPPPPPPPGQCGDGVDNDGDSTIDNLDPDCVSSAGISEFTASPPPPGGGPAVLNLRAVPSIVRSGNTSKVTWSASNVTACSVNGDNGDTWSGISSPVGGETSSPITRRVIYTLACTGTDGNPYGKTAIVNILPSWREI